MALTKEDILEGIAALTVIELKELLESAGFRCVVAETREPYEFVRSQFKVNPDPWQEEVLRAFPKTPRIAFLLRMSEHPLDLEVAAMVTRAARQVETLGAFLEVLDRVGVRIERHGDDLIVRGALAGAGAYRATDIRTDPYPGLATDLQSPTAVLLTQAAGTSRIHETIFEDRLEWMDELRRMGATIEITDTHHATITGPSRLRGAEVSMSDLRAGASLILAALLFALPNFFGEDPALQVVRRNHEAMDAAAQQAVENLKGAIVARYGDVYHQQLAWAARDIVGEPDPVKAKRDTPLGDLFTGDGYRWLVRQK